MQSLVHQQCHCTNPFVTGVLVAVNLVVIIYEDLMII